MLVLSGLLQKWRRRLPVVVSGMPHKWRRLPVVGGQWAAPEVEKKAPCCWCLVGCSRSGEEGSLLLVLSGLLQKWRRRRPVVGA